MEAKNQEAQGISASAGTPAVLSSPFPANVVQFPSTAVVSLAAPSSIGNILPLSLLNHSFLPSLQQQLPVPAEPVLLVPACSLSLSGALGYTATSPLFSMKLQSSSPLQYSQQLPLNNTQVPLVLKPPVPQIQLSQAIQTQPVNQPFIVLPNVAGESTEQAQSTDERRGLKAISEDQNGSHQSSKMPTADLKDTLKGKKEITKSSSGCSEIEKCNVSRMKTRLRNRKKKSATSDQSNPHKDSLSQKAESDSGLTSSGVNHLDIAQVISSLPSGWQVIGFTGLKAMEQSLQPSSIASEPTLLSSRTEVSVPENDCIATEIKHTADQPSLVSINLNTASQPIASETAFDKGNLNELTCSVKLDDIPCTHVISVKTECMESSEEEKHPDIKRDDQINEESNAVMAKPTAHTCPAPKASEVSSHGSLEPASSLHNTVSSTGLPPVNLLTPGTVTAHSTVTDSKWTVVGFTSLPPTSTTTTVSVSQANTMSSVQPSFKVDSCDSPAVKSSTSNTIILKIPLCSSAASSTATDKITSSSKWKAADKAEGRTLSPLQNDANQSTSSSEKLNLDNMKWTVVGLMGSGSSEPSVNQSVDPQTSSCISASSDLISIPRSVVSSPTIQALLSSTSQGNLGIKEILNAVSPVTSTGQFLSPARSSSSQISACSKTLTKQKLKSQESVKLAPGAASSPKNDNTNSDHSSSQSQSQDQWKIVGITPLGMIPPTPPSPLISLTPFTPLSPVGSMPLLISASSNASFPNSPTTMCNMMTQIASTVASPSLISSLLSSCPSPLSSSSSAPSPFPVVSLSGSQTNPSRALSAPPTILSSPSPATFQTLQDLAQQQNLSQLIQSQLAAFQNPISMLSVNDPNQWQVVGLVANNQVSLLGQSQGNSMLINPSDLIPAVSSANLQESRSSLVKAPASPSTKGNFRTEEKKAKPVEQGSSQSAAIWEMSPSKQKCSKTNCKFHHYKGPDKAKRKHDPEKIKKNTVSNLLKMKRMQQKNAENGNSENGDQNVKEYQAICEPSFEVPEKKVKTRSLRSYAGNRKLFTKTRGKDIDEKISLRSGTQIPVPQYQSEDDEMAENSSVNFEEEERQSTSDLNVLEHGKPQTDEIENLPMKPEGLSAARKRKLKVPRKMVADLDYHPFDSSSDSN